MTTRRYAARERRKTVPSSTQRTVAVRTVLCSRAISPSVAPLRSLATCVAEGETHDALRDQRANKPKIRTVQYQESEEEKAAGKEKPELLQHCDSHIIGEPPYFAGDMMHFSVKSDGETDPEGKLRAVAVARGEALDDCLRRGGADNGLVYLYDADESLKEITMKGLTNAEVHPLCVKMGELGLGMVSVRGEWAIRDWHCNRAQVARMLCPQTAEQLGVSADVEGKQA